MHCMGTVNTWFHREIYYAVEHTDYDAIKHRIHRIKALATRVALSHGVNAPNAVDLTVECNGYMESRLPMLVCKARIRSL